jgi:CDP-diglyceride synthetase
MDTEETRITELNTLKKELLVARLNAVITIVGMLIGWIPFVIFGVIVSQGASVSVPTGMFETISVQTEPTMVNAVMLLFVIVSFIAFYAFLFQRRARIKASVEKDKLAISVLIKGEKNA